MKKIITLILALITAFTLAACKEEAEPVTKMLTVHNDSKFLLTKIVLAPSKDELESDKAIVIFDETAAMPANTGLDYTLEFPEELYKGNWVAAIYGTDLEEMLGYSSVVELGDLFNTTDADYAKEVWGLKIGYDAEEEEEFTVTKLDGSHI